MQPCGCTIQLEHTKTVSLCRVVSQVYHRSSHLLGSHMWKGARRIEPLYCSGGKAAQRAGRRRMQGVLNRGARRDLVERYVERCGRKDPSLPNVSSPSRSFEVLFLPYELNSLPMLFHRAPDSPFAAYQAHHKGTSICTHSTNYPCRLPSYQRQKRVAASFSYKREIAARAEYPMRVLEVVGRHETYVRGASER